MAASYYCSTMLCIICVRPCQHIITMIHILCMICILPCQHIITMIRSRTAVYYFKPEYQIYRWHAAHCTSHTTGALHHTTTICITFDENVMLSCLFISSCITQLPFTKNLSNLTHLNLANLAQEQVNSPTTALISQLSKYIID